MGKATSRDRKRRRLPARTGLVGSLAAACVVAIVVPLALAGQRGGGKARAATAVGLHVIPFPSTPDASPQTHIVFSSLRPSDFAGKPKVVGSSSGVHHGRLTVLPDGAGTDFLPKQPFAPGETVTVQAALTSAQAGTRSGAPGSTSLSWSFTVGVAAPSGASAATAAASRPYAPAGVPAVTKTQRARSQPKATTARSWPHMTFLSVPRLRPPALHVTTEPAPGPEDFFVAPLPGTHRGLMILNHRGQLLWFHSVRPGLGSILAVQWYLGHRVLTYGVGQPVLGHDVGTVDEIMNSSYRTIAQVRAGWGYTADLHEFQLVPHGIALIDSYVPVHADLSSVGGSTNGTVYDCVIQKVDVRTGKVLWEWHALGHVPLTDSYSPVPHKIPFDFFHLNSIQELPGNKLLVSARDTWAVYLVDEKTGNIIWTLGGKRSSFTMGHGTRFEWQHDARMTASDTLSLFDDADYPQEESQSSAKVLKLNLTGNSVSLVHRYRHNPPLLTSYEGSAQLLPDKSMVVGWGTSSEFSEYSRTGRQVFNATFPVPVNTYRAYRFAWTGHPQGRPAVAVKHSHGTTWVYVSWNGATQVASWRVLGGSSAQTLTPQTSKAWSGFETAVALHSPVSYLAVQALDSHGKVLGTSRTVPGS